MNKLDDLRKKPKHVWSHLKSLSKNKNVVILTLIWVGFLGVLGVCFEVGEGGVKLPTPLSKTCYNYARNFKFLT